mgnify:CR=1 FL=1
MTKRKESPLLPWATVTPLERLLRKIRYDSGCWVWSGLRASGNWNYGRVTGLDGRQTAAHRLAYELLVGPIPDGLVIDHLCRNPACVNPIHLEPVTTEENVRRGASCRHSADTCTKGHPFSDENTGSRWYGGREWRFCKACKSQLQAEARRDGRWKRRPWSERSDNGSRRASKAA